MNTSLRSPLITCTRLVLCLLIALALVSCLPGQNTPVPTQRFTSTSTPASLPPTEATSLAAVLGEQEEALLPFAQGDLTKLRNLTRYTIQLKVNYKARSLEGHEQVDYTNMEGIALDRLYFRLLPNGHQSYGNGSLIVTNVEVEGKIVQSSLSLSDTVLEIPLTTPLPPSGQISLDFDFSGSVPLDFGGSETPAGYGIYNYSDGVLSLSGWYPILAVYDQKGWHLDPISSIGDSVYSDMALYTVDVIADSNLVLASTGVELSHEAQGDLKRSHVVSGPTRDFYLVLSPDYEVTSRTVEGTRINSYTLPGDSQGGEDALSVAASALQYYNQSFGGYPYPEFDVVETPLRNASGVEYPGIVMIAQNLYQQSNTPAFVITVAHEVAHQWWYNLVGDDVFADPWMDEALATYSSAAYDQSAQGESAYLGYINYLQTRYDDLVNAGQDDLVTQSLAHFESLHHPQIYSGVVYAKGALFFKALQDEIGDPAFFGALQNYYQMEKYQIAAPQDLLTAFDQAAGRSLDNLYQTWLYSTKK